MLANATRPTPGSDAPDASEGPDLTEAFRAAAASLATRPAQARAPGPAPGEDERAGSFD